MDYLSWFPERIAELRMQKNVSARDMSLSLGQSASYINKIENGHIMPSMAGFLYICEYFNMTPRQFFDARACLCQGDSAASGAPHARPGGAYLAGGSGSGGEKRRTWQKMIISY